MHHQLALDLTGALVLSRSSLAVKKKRQTLDALYEHRTELERR